MKFDRVITSTWYETDYNNVSIVFPGDDTRKFIKYYEKVRNNE